MTDEYSAGGIVFKTTDGQPKVLLCFQKKLSGAKVFCLPKGHIEMGETAENAALREVAEEAGVTAELVCPLGPVVYFFHERGRKVRKEVQFFLMRCLAENFTPNEETEMIRWCGRDEALGADPYASERRIMERAFEELERQDRLSRRA